VSALASFQAWRGGLRQDGQLDQPTYDAQQADARAVAPPLSPTPARTPAKTAKKDSGGLIAGGLALLAAVFS
jgi:hypothetical protein